MIELIDDHSFHLHNDKISYVLTVMENGQLGHLYYGKALGSLTTTELDYLRAQASKSAGTVKYSPTTGNFNLADRAQEYPVYGSSDFRRGALDVYADNDPWYLDFSYQSYTITDTKPRSLAQPATYAVGNQEAQELAITLVDQVHQLKLVTYYTIFRAHGVIARRSTLTNLGASSVMIQNMMSAVLELPDDQFEMVNLAGAWLKERHVKYHNLAQGTVAVESLKGASGHQHNPFIALTRSRSLTTGDVYASNLIYSGNFLSQVEVNEWHKPRLMTGISPAYFGWQLAPAATFSTPEALLYYSADGLNGLMAETQAVAQQQIADRQWQRRPRPIVFNNWEATYFNFDETKLLTLAQQAKQLGMECFVVDDGWFGHRDSDRTSLGDWRVDHRKFPHGMGHFAQQIHDLGLQMGLWFEPEMVSPDTPLYRDHPDWVVRHPYPRTAIGRGQYVLDFANPAVVTAIYAQIKPVIEAAQLDFIKWDMNRNITEAYSPYLAAQGLPQTEFFHRYILGVYDLYQRILTDFPDLLIEGCAGGGGRFDLGMLFYSPQMWPSDDSDAVERLSILSGTTLAYPLSAFSNHVSAVPNDQVGRMTPLKMRQNVADFGPLGYELDITKLPAPELAAIKANIDFYQQHRELLVNGHFQQLQSLDPDANTVAWSVANADQSELFVGFYRKLATPNTSVLNYLKLPNVAVNRHYQIDDGPIVSGQILQQFGLREPYQFNGANADTAELRGDFQSQLYHLVAVD
ncbi:alpha-galactosidase [Lactiplantibacillus pingfangensis]|uniref:alpha-galactosidase n=1 Tax=Lactiplantibacillus pingfangensis TaxID=2559915 RepID=UPI0010F8F46B|nr:alpha-galactosidase [Lactiplantibacillus pingfangensis]